MKLSNINEITLFEHQFWLQILGDHSRFILYSLSPTETNFINQANIYQNIFDSLLEKARKPMHEDGISDLNREAHSMAMKLREFKLTILNKQLVDKININLPPTFINHMLNELEEYINILNAVIIGKIPTTYDIHLHLLWLPDGAGHAATIESTLDMTEKELIKKSHEYKKLFTDLYLRTIEYNGYTRTGLYDFPALKKHNMEADEVMGYFKEFLKDLRNLIADNKVLGTLTPLMADHMFREECYYLTKLSMVSETKDPGCDPTKPRYEI